MGWHSALIERHNPRTNLYHFDFTSRILRTVFLMLVLFLALFFAFRSSPASAQGTTQGIDYYVDCINGNDENNGRDIAAAWKTIAEANEHTYQPGDRLLLNRDCDGRDGDSGEVDQYIFKEGLDLKGSGTEQKPITLGSYPDGESTLPVIDPFQDAALFMENNKHVVIENIEFTTHGYAPRAVDAESGNDVKGNQTAGAQSTVQIWGRGPAGVKNCGDACLAKDITIHNVEVDGSTAFTEFEPGRFRVADGSDAGGRGIYIAGGEYNADEDSAGRWGEVQDVTITNIRSHHNHNAGVETSGTYQDVPTYHVRNVRVLDSELDHNGGDGVVFGMTSAGLVQGVNAHNDGLVRNARLGAWAWASENVTIRLNHLHNNFTPAITQVHDGGGADCDLATYGCTIEYNWIEDNEGEGILLMDWPIGYGTKWPASRDLVASNNLLIDNARTHSGEFFLFGGARSQVTGNKVYAVNGPVINANKWGKSGVPVATFSGNTFLKQTGVTTQRTTNMFTLNAGELAFSGNTWHRTLPLGGFSGLIRDKAFSGWAKWQSKGYDQRGENPVKYDLSPYTNASLVNASLVSGATEEQVRQRLAQVGIIATP